MLLTPPDFGVGRVTAVPTWSSVATTAEDQVVTAGTRPTSKSGGLRSNLWPAKTPPQKPPEAEPQRQGTVMEQGTDQGD